jgi:hypothetical protein
MPPASTKKPNLGKTLMAISLNWKSVFKSLQKMPGSCSLGVLPRILVHMAADIQKIVKKN